MNSLLAIFIIQDLVGVLGSASDYLGNVDNKIDLVSMNQQNALAVVKTLTNSTSGTATNLIGEISNGINGAAAEVKAVGSKVGVDVDFKKSL